MKFLDSEQKKQVGFSFLMEKLNVITAYGILEKKEIRPFKISEKAELIKEFDDIEKLVGSIKENKDEYKKIERILMKFKDIINSIKRCRNNEILDEVELFEIKIFSLLVSELEEVLEKLQLKIEEVHLNSMEDLISLLDPEGKRMSTFYIYDNYSETLKNIRIKKREKENEIFKESDEEKFKLLKEQRLNIVIEEEEEEIKIRKDLSKKIYTHTKKIEENIKCIGRLDFLMAKAKLALKYNGIRPKMCDDMHINLKNSFNPEIVEILEKDKRDFTPVSIELRNGTTIITGANMGGKTITLKTLVLNLFLAQMGFFVFAEKAEFPVLDFIHFISDDMQSVSKGLSTFGAEIIRLKQVVECAKRGDGFIALDEFARGTNPKEGFYLVKSLAKYLQKYKSISLISTHYDGVVQEGMDHYQVIGLKNVDFEALKHKIDLNKTHSVEIIQQHMDYKLEKVSKENKVPKDALNISILLGLEEEIIDIAKEYYCEEDEYGK